MSYRKTAYQKKDYTAVFMGMSHNLGAGGVMGNKAIDNTIISRTRLRQEMLRGFRAVGL